MRYIVLNLVVTIIVLGSLLIHTRQKLSRCILISLIGLLVLTVIFDSLIIANGIVAYHTQNILGVYIWRAPIEDFLYTVVSVVFVGVMWEYYESKNT